MATRRSTRLRNDNNSTSRSRRSALRTRKKSSSRGKSKRGKHGKSKRVKRGSNRSRRGSNRNITPPPPPPPKHNTTVQTETEMGCIPYQSKFNNRDSEDSDTDYGDSTIGSDLTVRDKINIIINYWFMSETKRFNNFPDDIMTLTIEKFVYQRSFEFEMNRCSVKKQENFEFKICVIGDKNVGKSCIISQYHPTNYIDTKNVYINRKKIELKIVETCNKLDVGFFLMGSRGVLIFYDITNYESMKNIKYWNEQCIKFGLYNVQKLVIGNKLDLQDQRVCHNEDIVKILDQCKIVQNDIIEISTLDKIGMDINEIFLMLATDILNEITKLKTNPFWG